MMATCPHCGYSKTPPGKRSCFNCGRPLDAVAPGPTAAQPVAAAPVAAPQQTAPAASPGVSAPAPMPAVGACPHCGYSKTPPGKRSCFNCGRPLDAVAPGPTAAQPVAAAPVAAPQQTAPAASPGVSAPAPMPAVGACPHCGYSKTPPGKRSCFNCGRPLDAVAPGPTAAQPVAAAPVAALAPHTPQPAPPVGPPVWVPTHRVPPPGIAAWDAPDPSRPAAGQLPGNLELVVEATAGAWAHVRVANGWRGWVDGRLLIPISAG